ncbi:signal peptidase I [Caldisalinibacter kiritimatiensis]|uniref:Signal peptidase I n=1 Tax=Caldisalinibacter kiritimatiensis TaxID=1304284 RepID=R1ATB6_9FIRM|nr:signal peptidase I [Caldisalinibacter kiritimatiensis]EOD00368.1 Signal peptidase I [Caldisalinibacter kiritimatiensis]
MAREIYEWIKSIALAIILAIIIKTFIFNTTYVIGTSMNPTLQETDRLFTNKIVYRISEPKRRDIVVLKAPDEPKKDYIKRVIAVEGDLVEIKNGKVYVNGEELKETYIHKDIQTGEYIKTLGNIKLKVPENYVYVLGDNRYRNASKDSRYFGPVPIKSVKGKAFFRFYPFDRFGSIH